MYARTRDRYEGSKGRRTTPSLTWVNRRRPRLRTKRLPGFVAQALLSGNYAVGKASCGLPAHSFFLGFLRQRPLLHVVDGFQQFDRGGSV